MKKVKICRIGAILLPLFILLLLGTAAMRVNAAEDTEQGTVTVIVPSIRIIWLSMDDDEDPETYVVTFEIDETDMDDGEKVINDFGRLFYHTNDEWEVWVKRSVGGFPSGLNLHVKYGTSWPSWSPLSETYQPFCGDGPGTGSFLLDWKVSGLSWDIDPGTYSETVTFKIEAPS